MLFLADRAAVVVVDSGVGTILASNLRAGDSRAVNLRNADLAATALDLLFTVAALNLRAVILVTGFDRTAGSAAVIRTLELFFTISAVEFRALNVRAAGNAGGAAFTRRNDGAFVVTAGNLSAGGSRAVGAFSTLARGAVIAVLLVTIGAVQSASNGVASRSVFSADFAAIGI